MTTVISVFARFMTTELDERGRPYIGVHDVPCLADEESRGIVLWPCEKLWLTQGLWRVVFVYRGSEWSFEFNVASPTELKHVVLHRSSTSRGRVSIPGIKGGSHCPPDDDERDLDVPDDFVDTDDLIEGWDYPNEI